MKKQWEILKRDLYVMKPIFRKRLTEILFMNCTMLFAHLVFGTQDKSNYVLNPDIMVFIMWIVINTSMIGPIIHDYLKYWRKAIQELFDEEDRREKYKHYVNRFERVE